MPDQTPKFTDEQLDAINTIDKSVIVSAAAGSGKTAVLAERCVHLIVDPESACDVDRLLVVTFTNDAAEEMRSRIEKRLRARLESAPLDDRLEKQLYLIQRAQISTIHGFCNRIIQQHFHLLGLDPGTQLLQEEEASLLRTQLMRDLIHERYARPRPADFENLVAWYFDSNDERLVGAVMHLYHLLTSVVDPHQWVLKARKHTRDATADLSNSRYGQYLFRLIANKLNSIIAQCDAFCQMYQREAGLSGYVSCAAEIKVEAQARLKLAIERNLDDLSHAAASFEPAKLKAARGVDAAIREPAKESLDRIRDELKKGTLASLCRYSSAEWSAGLKTTESSIVQLLALTRQFTRAYQKAKRAIRSMDFSDLERYAMQILSQHPEVAAQYREQFCHVLVDEFQDINDVQKQILSLVSRETGEDENVNTNLFTVGDVKQSIYRFRLADPTLFLNRYRDFTEHAGTSRKAIDLQKNFRSRGPLLEAINLVFERLMSRETAEIDYDARQKLIPGIQYPFNPTAHFNGTPVELHLLEKPPRGSGDVEITSDDALEDLDRSEREAMFVAHRIQEIMNRSPAVEVCEKSESGLVSRLLRYKDIVVLLRSRRVKAQQFSEQLQQAGIPVHAETGSGFFESLEIRDVIALLQLLDNRQQDIPMAAVLRSPFVNLPHVEDALSQIRLPCRGGNFVPFHQAALRYAEQPNPIGTALKRFLMTLERWRNLAHRKPLTEVIAMILNESGYINWCAGLPNGRQRMANLLDLLERAKQFGSFQRQGLGRFLDFLTKLEEQSDLGQPSMLGEGEDAVRIMTIHASKGLEFPVVFVADLGKRHNFADERSIVLSERSLGIALNAVDPVKRIRYPSISSMAVQHKMHAAAIAEELRVLYVAMTRAREHLVLVGTCEFAQLAKWQDKWTRWKGPFPADDVVGGKMFLDWIVPSALAINPVCPGTFELQQHKSEELEKIASQRQHAKPDLLDATLRALGPLKSAPKLTDSARQVIVTISAKYPHEELTHVSATQSVTAAAKQQHDEPPSTARQRAGKRPETTLSPPRFLLGEDPLSPVDAGTATHLALEHLDFSNAATVDAIEKQIQHLLDSRLILPQYAQVVDRNAIAWLMGTEVGALLKQHNAALRREWPINFSQPTGARSGLDVVMIRGRLDLLIPTDAGLIIIDYKTDRVNSVTVEERVKTYQPQLAAYAKAIEQISSRKVIAQYLVFLTARMLRAL